MTPRGGHWLFEGGYLCSPVKGPIFQAVKFDPIPKGSKFYLSPYVLDLIDPRFRSQWAYHLSQAVSDVRIFPQSHVWCGRLRLCKLFDTPSSCIDQSHNSIVWYRSISTLVTPSEKCVTHFSTTPLPAHTLYMPICHRADKPLFQVQRRTQNGLKNESLNAYDYFITLNRVYFPKEEWNRQRIPQNICL